MHMLSRKDLNFAELETVRVSRNSTTAITANGEVQTNEEATVHVNNFDLLEGAAPRGDASSPNAWQILKITDIHNSGPVVKNHTLSKTEGKYDATRTTACLWLFRTDPLDLLNLLGSPWVRRQHRNRRRHCKMSKSIPGTLHGSMPFIP